MKKRIRVNPRLVLKASDEKVTPEWLLEAVFILFSGTGYINKVTKLLAKHIDLSIY